MKCYHCSLRLARNGRFTLELTKTLTCEAPDRTGALIESLNYFTPEVCELVNHRGMKQEDLCFVCQEINPNNNCVTQLQ